MLNQQWNDFIYRLRRLSSSSFQYERINIDDNCSSLPNSKQIQEQPNKIENTQYELVNIYTQFHENIIEQAKKQLAGTNRSSAWFLR